MAQVGSRIRPSMWFDGRAREAAEFYVGVFPNSRMLSPSEIAVGQAEGGSVVEFELDGQRFEAFDGGPGIAFTLAISFNVACETQEEIDYYWERLSEGGATSQCGWLEDRFGVSWQIVPAMLGEIIARDPARVMGALLAMEKLDITALREAAGSR
ncbi:MAG: VOC family protein [Dehalococcoidia bacterium]|nr:VOC family protein [Dehalococcoidia bacterium]MYA52954.1 VOC family protein [Dehalococcoidia bacterium]MYH67587.1 VOC family protein [Dehalococcoidia bacterium]